MTTKTDFHAIQELREKYTPKVRGIVSGEEAKTICEVLKADIGWTEVREEPRLGCFYQKTIGMMPRLSLSLWTPSDTPGMWCSRGLGAVVKITDTIYQKRNWNELAKFTAEWDEKRLLEEANKHMAELQNDVVA